MRVFTGKCAIIQNGSGTGYWQVAVTNFSDPGGQFDTTEIQAGDFLIFTDSGDFYQLEVTEVVSASGSNATIKVSNVGVTGISSVPTTSNAAITRGSTNYELIPWVANLSANENQLFTEDLMVKIDTALDSIAGGGGGPTNLTFTGASTPYSLNSSTGTGVTIAAGSGITLSRVSNELTIAASGGGGGGANLTFTGTSPITLNSDSGTDVTFTQGTNISLVRSGNNMTISAPNALIGVTDQINGLDIANNSGNITIAPNIPELTDVSNAYDANDQVMIYDNSGGNHKRASMGTYLGSGFVDLTNNQTNIAGIKGFTTTLQRGSGSLPTGSTFGSTTGTVFFLAGSSTNMTDSNFINGSGLAIHTHIPSPDINKQTTYFTATGNDTGNDSGEFVFRTNNGGGSNFTNAINISPTGRLLTMRGSGVDGSSGGDIIVGNDGLGFEGQAVNYVFKTVAATGQEFVLTEAGGAKCYTGVGSSQWTFPSDERLKQNIEELSVLDKIHLMKGVTYELKSDGIPQIGVIAQDIQKAFSHGVRQADGYLGVGAMTVAAISLQGVKELKEENDNLKQQIQALVKRLEKLEKIK